VISHEYEAATTRAALIGRADRGRIVVSGKDAASYLHGLLTNDITALKAAEGCYAAYLTAQGRMIADMWVYQLGDVVLLSMLRDLVPTVLTKLEQFVFSEDVQLADASESTASVAVVGPLAAEIVAAVVALGGDGAARLARLSEHASVRGTFHGESVVVISVSDTGVAGYDLVVGASSLTPLTKALHGAGAIDASGETADVLRVEAGVPKFHRDMDEDTIPLEAGIESRAISLTKGCYVGQEVIIRVLHRGHGRVARKLAGLALGGETAVAPGTAILVDGREVGQVTSSVVSPALNRPIALAYLLRGFLDAGTSVSVNNLPATVTPLPFVTS